MASTFLSAPTFEGLRPLNKITVSTRSRSGLLNGDRTNRFWSDLNRDLIDLKVLCELEAAEDGMSWLKRVYGVYCLGSKRKKVKCE
ncbi:hypothetical protein QVD17_20967 [Tagetes erecta]|uniref:Uncharacterized protein n=1 Tax=Tagetes erecta TaxID=13708 RepID=A0AAD8NXQ1_TARER|nr:hypothetical protein QVD17_20967 [Tagetes erecta]